MLTYGMSVLAFQLASASLLTPVPTRNTVPVVMRDHQVTLSRRAILLSAPVLSASPAFASTTLDRVTELDKTVPKAERNIKGSPDTRAPIVVVTSSTATAFEVQVSVPGGTADDEYVEYM